MCSSDLRSHKWLRRRPVGSHVVAHSKLGQHSCAVTVSIPKVQHERWRHRDHETAQKLHVYGVFLKVPLNALAAMADGTDVATETSVAVRLEFSRVECHRNPPGQPWSS